MLLRRNVEITRATILFLELLDRWAFLFESLEHSVWDKCWAVKVVALFGLGNMESVHDSFLLLRVFALLGQTMVHKDVTRLCLDIFNTIT